MSAENDASKFISRAAGAQSTGILYNGDADGISAAVVVHKCLERLGQRDIKAIPLGRGQRPDSSLIKGLVKIWSLSSLIIVDAGSTMRDADPGIPVLVIDHHHPLEQLPAGVFFNTYSEEPQATASLAAYAACLDVAPVRDLAWVAAIGAVSDLGPRVPFAEVKEGFDEYGRRALLDLAVLINAGYRHRDYRVELAFNALLSASRPPDLLQDAEPTMQRKTPGLAELVMLKREVQDEF